MLVFLLILITGIIDLGRGIFTNISIQEAAQEGAFYASFDPDADVAAIEARAIASTSSPALTPGEITVNCVGDVRSLRNGARVTVTVTHDLALITPFVGQWMGGSLTLSKTAEADRFFDSCPT